MIRKAVKRTRRVTRHLKQQFRMNVVTSILAALGVVIALVWRDVIESSVDHLIQIMGLGNGSGILSKVIVACIVTIICVFGIFLFSKYKPEEK